MATERLKKWEEIDFTNGGTADPSKWGEVANGDGTTTYTATAGAAVRIDKPSGATQTHTGAGIVGLKLTVDPEKGTVKVHR